MSKNRSTIFFGVVYIYNIIILAFKSNMHAAIYLRGWAFDSHSSYKAYFL